MATDNNKTGSTPAFLSPEKVAEINKALESSGLNEKLQGLSAAIIQATSSPELQAAIEAAKKAQKQLEATQLQAAKGIQRMIDIATDPTTTLADDGEQEAPSGGKTPDSLLKSFRKQTSAHGYKGITAEMVEAVAEYGTNKDKAILIHLGYQDMRAANVEPIVSEKRSLEIKSEIYSSGGGKDIVSVFSAYYMLRFILPDLLKVVKYNFLNQAREAAFDLNEYLWLQRRERLYNFVRTYVPDAELTVLAQELNTELDDNGQYGRLTLSPDGYKEEDAESLWEQYKESVEDTSGYLSEYKGALQGVINWAKNRKLTSIIPYNIREEIETAPRATHIYDIPLEYYSKYVREQEAQGHTYTQEEKERAFFPSYEDVKQNDRAALSIFEKLSMYYNTLYNEYSDKFNV